MEPNTDLADRITAELSDRYEVVTEIGRGGMAVVFLARDLRHGRDVAIKVFPEFGASQGAERFLQEIRTTASLAHPHILPLLDSGSTGDLLYYVMPYIEGDNLRDRLVRERQLSIEVMRGVVAAVAGALDYAHRRGVIHRDIKPENILLHEGGPLVADFGIALALTAATEKRITQTGHSLGTPQYMSPEQAAGDRELDARSDIYSLGCVAYEMLTGEPPHSGATLQAIMSKVMTEKPTPVHVVRHDVPDHIEAAVDRALAKVPAERFATAAAFAEALTRPAPTPLAPTVSFSGHHTIRRIAKPVAAIVAILAATWTWSMVRGDPDPAFPGAPKIRQITFSGDASEVAAAPDGEMVAYLTENRRTLVLTDLDGETELRLLESADPMGPPRWSPNGARILIWANIAGTRGLFTVPRLGGQPQPLTENTGGVGRILGSPGMGYAFGGSDSVFVLACCGAILYVGSDPRDIVNAIRDQPGPEDSGVLLDLGETFLSLGDVALSPDRHRVAFTGTTRNQEMVLGVVNLEDSEIHIIDSVEGLDPGRYGALGSPQWRTHGEGLFYRRRSGSGTSVVLASLNGRGGTTGTGVVLPNLPANAGFSMVELRQRLVYAGAANRTHLELVSRDGSTRRLSRGTWTFGLPSMAPDGTRLAYVKGDGSGQNIYLMETETGEETRVTEDQNLVGPISWSPDGSRLAYSSSETAAAFMVVDLSSGIITASGPENSGVGAQSALWSPDGRALIVADGRTGLARLDLETNESTPITLFAGDGQLTGAQPRPPGGDSLRRLAPPARAGNDRQVRSGIAVLSPDGRTLAIFRSARERGIWSVPLDGGPPELLVEAFAFPLAWTEAGLYFVRNPMGSSGTTVIELATAEGESVVHLEMPFNCEFFNLTMSADGESAVCAVSEGLSDVWLVEGLGIPD